MFRITLKALANSSPGFALKPWVKESEEILRNSEGVATVLLGRRDATPSELRVRKLERILPGFQNKPWAGISQRFQRNSKHFKVLFVCFSSLCRVEFLQEALKVEL